MWYLAVIPPNSAMILKLPCWLCKHFFSIYLNFLHNKIPVIILLLSIVLNVPLDFTQVLKCWYPEALSEIAMQQRAKRPVVFHVSKAYSPADAYGNRYGIISKRVWRTFWLCSTLEEEKRKTDVKTIQVSPLWGWERVAFFFVAVQYLCSV